MPLPTIITKSWLSHQFGRTFRYLRKHLLTDKVIKEELGFDLDEFKKWRDFPPMQSRILKDWLIEKQLLD